MTAKTCPDCRRPLGQLPPHYRLGDCVGRMGSSYRPDCLEHTIARLRAELASARELDAVALAVVDDAVRMVEHALKFGGGDTILALDLERMTDHVGQLIALRAKKAGT